MRIWTPNRGRGEKLLGMWRGGGGYWRGVGGESVHTKGGKTALPHAVCLEKHLGGFENFWGVQRGGVAGSESGGPT